jgi:hypothetical protein
MTTPGGPLPGQPLPLRMLLDQAVAVSRRHFRSIYPAVAIPLALASGSFPIVQLVFMDSMMTGQGQRPDPARMVPLVAAILVGALVLLVVYLLGHGALFIAAMDAAAGRAVQMRRAWRMIARPRIRATTLLSSLAFVAGLMCCILPGIYIGLLFSLVIPVMVEEGVTGSAALGRSADLIRYNPQKDIASDPRGKAFLIAFVGALMGYALAFLLQLPFIIAQQVYMLRGAAGGQSADPEAVMMVATLFQVPSNMLGTLGQTAVQLYIAIGLALLYLDIRGRKEGFDLEAAIARLEGGPPAAGGPPG